jgi:cysteinyl-tRNA synthetase
VRYRRAPPRAARSRGWEAQAVQSDRVPPINFPRAVKTVRIFPPTQPTASDGSLTVASLNPDVPASRPPLAAPMGKAPEVKNWRYQLQGVHPATIAKSSSDLVVIDYSNGDRPFTRAEVEQMRRKPDGSRRIVLSYMSIGEAEDYRWYWSGRSSSWLGKENPKWKGNYGVRFWHEDWQKIVFEYTDKILAAGFDGVYLDKVDEYEEMGHKDEMVEFVARIGERAKAQRSDFLIVSQNGDQLIPNPKFRKAIDAFAREDLYYGEDSDGKRNKTTSIRESVARLKLLTAEGKPVFVVEYPKNDKQAKTATREISEQGFVGLMARRSLDVLER